jgi:hypothetical protein
VAAGRNDVLMMLDSGSMAALTLDPLFAAALWQFTQGREVFVMQPTSRLVIPPP